VSRGQLQHDMWGVPAPSQRWDWDGLRRDIATHGVRNSLLVAPMPTASTSQVRAALQMQSGQSHMLQSGRCCCYTLALGLHTAALLWCNQQ